MDREREAKSAPRARGKRSFSVFNFPVFKAWDILRENLAAFPIVEMKFDGGDLGLDKVAI